MDEAMSDSSCLNNQESNVRTITGSVSNVKTTAVFYRAIGQKTTTPSGLHKHHFKLKK